MRIFGSAWEIKNAFKPGRPGSLNEIWNAEKLENPGYRLESPLHRKKRIPGLNQ